MMKFPLPSTSEAFILQEGERLNSRPPWPYAL